MNARKIIRDYPAALVSFHAKMDRVIKVSSNKMGKESRVHFSFASIPDHLFPLMRDVSPWENEASRGETMIVLFRAIFELFSSRIREMRFSEVPDFGMAIFFHIGIGKKRTRASFACGMRATYFAGAGKTK